jgi:hypothetical protein
VLARPSQTEFVPLPTFGVVPVSTAPRARDVAAQPSGAVANELAAITPPPPTRAVAAPSVEISRGTTRFQRCVRRNITSSAGERGSDVM